MRERGPPPTLFDPCLERGACTPAELSELARFGVRGALFVPPWDERPHEAAHVATQVSARAAGLEAHFAVGLGPAIALGPGVDAALRELPARLSQPHVRALGRLALGRGGEQECALFVRQLELANELQRPVLVEATPSDARRVAALLLASELPRERILVACRDAASVRLLRGLGLPCALHVHARALSAGSAVKLVRSLGPSGLCLASAGARGGGDLLALPHVAMRLSAAGLHDAVVRRVALENPRVWLGLRSA